MHESQQVYIKLCTKPALIQKSKEIFYSVLSFLFFLYNSNLINKIEDNLNQKFHAPVDISGILIHHNLGSRSRCVVALSNTKPRNQIGTGMELQYNLSQYQVAANCDQISAQVKSLSHSSSHHLKDQMTPGCARALRAEPYQYNNSPWNNTHATVCAISSKEAER